MRRDVGSSPRYEFYWSRGNHALRPRGCAALFVSAHAARARRSGSYILLLKPLDAAAVAARFNSLLRGCRGRVISYCFLVLLSGRLRLLNSKAHACLLCVGVICFVLLSVTYLCFPPANSDPLFISSSRSSRSCFFTLRCQQRSTPRRRLTPSPAWVLRPTRT